MSHVSTSHAVSSPQIDTVNVYACTVIGYLVYTLAQVFLFCFFGNRLIEEVRCIFTMSLKTELPRRVTPYAIYLPTQSN